MCPVCDKAILYDNLVIDGYFTKVLDSRLLPSDCTEVEMKIDGSWEPKIICGKYIKAVSVVRMINVNELYWFLSFCAV